MYYQEKIVNGKLCYKTSPNGRWIEFSSTELTNLYLKKADHVKLLRVALENLLGSYKADFHNITGGELNNTEAVLQAKEALSKIS